MDQFVVDVVTSRFYIFRNRATW